MQNSYQSASVILAHNDNLYENTATYKLSQSKYVSAVFYKLLANVLSNII